MSCKIWNIAVEDPRKYCKPCYENPDDAGPLTVVICWCNISRVHTPVRLKYCVLLLSSFMHCGSDRERLPWWHCDRCKLAFRHICTFFVTQSLSHSVCLCVCVCVHVHVLDTFIIGLSSKGFYSQSGNVFVCACVCICVYIYICTCVCMCVCCKTCY